MADYTMMAIDNQSRLAMFKIHRFLPFFWYEDHSDRSTYNWVAAVWKWQHFETSVKLKNNVNSTLKKWLITPWWQQIIKINFQYSKSTDAYLSFGVKIIQIGSYTLELTPFKNDNILQLYWKRKITWTVPLQNGWLLHDGKR